MRKTLRLIAALIQVLSLSAEVRLGDANQIWTPTTPQSAVLLGKCLEAYLEGERVMARPLASESFWKLDVGTGMYIAWDRGEWGGGIFFMPVRDDAPIRIGNGQARGLWKWQGQIVSWKGSRALFGSAKGEFIGISFGLNDRTPTTTSLFSFNHVPVGFSPKSNEKAIIIAEDGIFLVDSGEVSKVTGLRGTRICSAAFVKEAEVFLGAHDRIIRVSLSADFKQVISEQWYSVESK